MEKLRFKTLQSEAELEEVVSKIESHTGVRLPTAYLKKCKVVGAFLGKNLAGGYLLVTNPSFRSLMFVPDRAKAQDAFFGEDQFDMMEVNGLWLGSTLKTPELQARFWLKLIFDIFTCRKKYILLMRNIKTKSMERYFAMLNSKSLYRGVPQLIGEQNSHSEIDVSFTTRWSLLINLPKYVLEYRDRRKRAQIFDSERKLVPVRAMSNSQAR